MSVIAARLGLYAGTLVGAAFTAIGTVVALAGGLGGLVMGLFATTPGPGAEWRLPLFMIVGGLLGFAPGLLMLALGRWICTKTRSALESV